MRCALFAERLEALLDSLGRRTVELTGYTDQCPMFQSRTPFCLRSEFSKQKHVYEEVSLVDLEQRYGSTESGRQYIQDITNTQRGKPHPDPKAGASILFILHF